MAKGKKKTAEELLKAEKLNYEKLKEELSKSKQKIKELEEIVTLNKAKSSIPRIEENNLSIDECMAILSNHQQKKNETDEIMDFFNIDPNEIQPFSDSK